MAIKNDIEVREEVSTSQRISIGLVALSLGFISLSLGIALLSSNAAVLFATPNVSLSSTPSTATAVTLTWTAPGDDGAVGTATSYDLRRSTDPITDQNFASATALPSPPLPQVAGSTQTYTAINLAPSTTYYFALKTTDDANNVSGLSNIASKTTSALSQACVPVYSCTEWSACTNGNQTRTCTVTNGCPAGLDEPLGSQTCTVPPVITDPGTTPPPTDTTPPPTDTTSPPTGTEEGGPVIRVNRHIIAVGTGIGTPPRVRVVTPATGKVTREFAPFTGTERNGTNVAVGEFTGDRQADIVVATGAGTSAKVKVFTDRGVKITEFNPYPTIRGTGVSVAAGDVNGDGRDELITVPAKGTSQVRIFSYDQTTKKFVAYAQGFAFDRRLLNGFSIASADLDLDGRAEIIVAPRTNGKTVTVWRVTSNKTLRKIVAFTPYPITPASGLTVSTGDINGDGRPDILTSMGAGYWSHIKVFDLRGRLLAAFEPSARSFLGGVSLTGLDVNSDGRDEVVTGTYFRGDPTLQVFRYDGALRKFKRIQSYSVYPSQMQYGLRLGSI